MGLRWQPAAGGDGGPSAPPAVTVRYAVLDPGTTPAASHFTRSSDRAVLMGWTGEKDLVCAYPASTTGKAVVRLDGTRDTSATASTASITIDGVAHDYLTCADLYAEPDPLGIELRFVQDFGTV